LIKFSLVIEPVLPDDAQALPCPVGPGGHWPDPDWEGFCMSWIGAGFGLCSQAGNFGEDWSCVGRVLKCGMSLRIHARRLTPSPES
jgi:hypothetical protein